VTLGDALKWMVEHPMEELRGPSLRGGFHRNRYNPTRCCFQNLREEFPGEVWSDALYISTREPEMEIYVSPEQQMLSRLCAIEKHLGINQK